jgi:hypothetical protein
VNSASAWNAAINKIRNGGDNQDYIIHVTGTVTVPAIPNNENLFGDVVGISVTIQGGGTLAMSNSPGSLIQIGAGQTVILKNVTIRGNSSNTVGSAVVRILRDGALHIEEGTLITGNNNNYVGGGVYIDGGIFTMQSGIISGNIGGGVYISNGTFTMKGGTISGNTLYAGGAGVVIERGTFNMEGGIISNNTAKGGNGGGVFVNGRVTFTKTGGIIYGSDASSRDRNTSSWGNSGNGHALYWETNPSSRWRNATAGPDDRTDGYGFWLND